VIQFIKDLLTETLLSRPGVVSKEEQPGLGYDELKRVALITVSVLLVGTVLALFIVQTAQIITTFYISVVLSHAVEPIIALGERFRIPRVLTIVAVYLFLLFVIGFVLFLLVPPLVAELTALANSLPQGLVELERFLQSMRIVASGSQTAALLQEAARRLGQELVGLADALLLLPLRLTELVILLITIPIVSFYWLVNSVQIEDTFLSLLPPARRNDAREILTEMAQKTGSYIRGEGIAMLTVGIMTYAGLSLLGVNYALVLAVVAGLLEIIPFVGPPLAAIPAVAVAFFVSPLLAAEVVVLYIVVQQIESNLLIPNIMSKQVGLHPLTVIAALWIGGTILGLVGAFLAIPAAASVQVLVERVLFPWIRSWRW